MNTREFASGFDKAFGGFAITPAGQVLDLKTGELIYQAEKDEEGNWAVPFAALAKARCCDG